MKTLLKIAALLVVVVLAACDGDEKDIDPATLVKGYADSKGGWLEHAAGASITVPAGALANPIILTLDTSATITPEEVAAFHKDHYAVSSVWEFGPFGTTLFAPAKIRVPIDLDDYSNLVVLFQVPEAEDDKTSASDDKDASGASGLSDAQSAASSDDADAKSEPQDAQDEDAKSDDKGDNILDAADSVGSSFVAVHAAKFDNGFAFFEVWSLGRVVVLQKREPTTCTSDDGVCPAGCSYTKDSDCCTTVTVDANVFGAVRLIDSTADGVEALAVAELSGDERVDVVAALPQSRKLVKYDAGDDGTFSSPIVLASQLRFQDVVAADLDGDKAQDIVAAVEDEGVLWLANQGAGAFAAPAVVVVMDDVVRVWAADLDADGDQDLLIATSRKLLVASGNGDGTFAAPGSFFVADGDEPVGLAAAIGDLNGDSKPDIVVSRYDLYGEGNGTLRWFKNDGELSFLAMSSFDETLRRCFDVTLADFDGDSDLDLFVAATDDDRIVRFTNQGEGKFSQRVEVKKGIDSPRSLVAMDMDGDAAFDLVVAAGNNAYDRVDWLEFSPEGLATRTVVKEADGAHVLVPADLNGDGVLDLALGSKNDDSVFWLMVGGYCNCKDDAMCDDDSVCTTDKCEMDECKYSKVPNCCEDVSDCEADDDICTETVCKSNLCGHEAIDGCCKTVDDCEDNDVCTSQTCESNECQYKDIAGCCKKVSDCDDDDACTVESCTDNKCGSAAKEIPGGAPCCNDLDECQEGNVCVLTSCQANACGWTPLESVGACKASGQACTARYHCKAVCAHLGATSPICKACKYLEALTPNGIHGGSATTGGAFTPTAACAKALLEADNLAAALKAVDECGEPMATCNLTVKGCRQEKGLNWAGRATFLGGASLPTDGPIVFDLVDWDGQSGLDTFYGRQLEGAGNPSYLYAVKADALDLDSLGGEAGLLTSQYGDFNGDGHLDLFTGFFDGTKTGSTLLSGKADGSFGKWQILTSFEWTDEIPLVYDGHSVDANGDGRADLFWLTKVFGLSEATQAFTAGRLASDGTLQSAALAYVPGSAETTFLVADLDHNGSFALYRPGSAAGKLVKSPLDTTAWPFKLGEDVELLNLSGGAWIEAGDADGDGDDDLWVRTNAGKVLWIENGQSTFSSHDIATSDAGAKLVARIADADLDGDFDLFTLEPDAGSVKLYLNDGSGSFGEAAEVAKAAKPVTMRIADVDGDSDPDIALLLDSDDGIVLDYRLSLGMCCQTADQCDDGIACTTDACVNGACVYKPLDADGDGYGAKSCGGTDCDDGDKSINPGATEVCGDGKDNNCNGQQNEGSQDTDNDGQPDCVDPDDDNDGTVDEKDCAPLDKDVHPKATEVCDGKDNNCNDQTDEELECVTFQGRTFVSGTNVAIAGASVDLKAAGNCAVDQTTLGDTQTVTTDSAGEYKIVTAAGDYCLESSANGYSKMMSTDVATASGDLRQVDFGFKGPDDKNSWLNICGRTRDTQSKALLAGTSVKLGAGSALNVVSATTTDEKGNYCINRVDLSVATSWPTTAVAEGYFPKIETATGLVANVVKILDFELAPDTATVCFEEGFEGTSADSWTASAVELGCAWHVLENGTYVNSAVGKCVTLAAEESCTPDATLAYDPCQICSSAAQTACIPAAGSLPRAYEGTHFIWFGNEDEWNFLSDKGLCDDDANKGGKGVKVGGTWTSPALAVNGDASDLRVRFRYWYEIEGVSPSFNYDRMEVFVSADGKDFVKAGAVNPDLSTNGAKDQGYTSAGFAKVPVWTLADMTLDATVAEKILAAETVFVRFSFQSHDHNYNAFRGWVVDEVKVVGEGCVAGGIKADGLDCTDIWAKGKDSGSGIYTIDPDGDDGPGQPYKVYCDMAEVSAGWTMVYKLSSGNIGNPFTTWSDTVTLHEGDKDYLKIGASEEIYKSSYVDGSWNSNGGNVAQVRVVLYDAAGTALKTVHFDGADSTKINFMDFENLLYSPWSDQKTATPNYHSVTGHAALGRYFFMSKSYGGCSSDTGWMVAKQGNSPCAWEAEKAPHLSLLYCDSEVGCNFNTQYFKEAATMAVFVRSKPWLATSCKDVKAKGWAAGNGVYRVDADGVGPAEPEDVYCDFETDGKAWTMVYKVSDDVSDDVFSLWNGTGISHAGEAEYLNFDKVGAHYKSAVANAYWEDGGSTPTEVRVVLYELGEPVKTIKFNAVGSTKSNWFTKANILAADWTDLTKEHTTANLDISGFFGRPFWVMAKSGPCHNDTGWMAIGPAAGCSWQSLEEGYINIVYSTGDTATNLNNGYGTAVKVADAMAIFVH